MKSLILLSTFALSVTTAFADTNCTSDIERVLSNLAPQTGEVKVTGKYTKKSKSGEYKACALSIKLDGDRLVPSFTPESFNPTYGDGAAFWPFGTYPTVEVPTNEHMRLRSYSCSAGENDFSIDYSYKSRGGWRKSSRYTVVLEKNEDETFSASLRVGNGDIFDKLFTCKGTISEGSVK